VLEFHGAVRTPALFEQFEVARRVDAVPSKLLEVKAQFLSSYEPVNGHAHE